MMSTLDRTLRSALAILLFVAGAAFFYVAGLGTGLYVAHTTLETQPSPIALLPATPTPFALMQTPPLTPTQEAPPPASEPTRDTTSQPSQSEDDAFDIFWEAWHILKTEFYGELPAESELPYVAIRGVIAATGDQYTAFLDPAQAEIMRADLSGGYEGIGATVRIRPDGKTEIVQPLAGWPAIEAGLRAKDVVLKVDDVDLQGITLYEVISLIRGPAGTIARLLVEREGVEQPFVIEIERARIVSPVVEARMLEDGVGYVRLAQFGQTATEDLKKALRDLEAEDPSSLILDLRGNRGGYLSTAIEVTSQFVGDGPILIEKFRDGREQRHPAIPGGIALEVPMVVLVDGASASASEIAAGAIQDTGRGILIGTTTLGKGSVQAAHTLSDGAQLRVTIARWFTPGGWAIHGEGLTPDIEVEVTEEDLIAGRDTQLERAIDYLREGE